MVGTGISRDDIELASKARYVSVRGPITAPRCARSGGPRSRPSATRGPALPDPADRTGRTNGRIALVRHHSHRGAPIDLPDHVDELSVLMSRREDIEAFLRPLAGYDAVITSAMHVMAACQSYGSPAGWSPSRSFEDRVHGNGTQVRGLRPGAGVEVVNPGGRPRPGPRDLVGRSATSGSARRSRTRSRPTCGSPWPTSSTPAGAADKGKKSTGTKTSKPKR